jgi:hypothetical protein
MDLLTHLAEAASLILIAELLVMLVLLAAVSLGLAYGPHWLVGKSGDAFEKVNAQLPTAKGYVHTGNEVARKPFIQLNRLTEAVTQRTLALRDRLQAARSRQSVPAPATPEDYPAEIETEAYPPGAETVEMVVPAPQSETVEAPLAPEATGYAPEAEAPPESETTS